MGLHCSSTDSSSTQMDQNLCEDKILKKTLTHRKPTTIVTHFHHIPSFKTSKLPPPQPFHFPPSHNFKLGNIYTLSIAFSLSRYVLIAMREFWTFICKLCIQTLKVNLFCKTKIPNYPHSFPPLNIKKSQLPHIFFYQRLNKDIKNKK